MITDADFLNWVADRLVSKYGESENVDFVQKLRRMARASEDDTSPTVIVTDVPEKIPPIPPDVLYRVANLLDICARDEDLPSRKERKHYREAAKKLRSIAHSVHAAHAPSMSQQSIKKYIDTQIAKKFEEMSS